MPYLAKLLGCSRRTIERGLAELDTLPKDPAAGHVRRPGAGRKKKRWPDAPVAQHLKSVLETRTAGDPDDATRVCTERSPALLSVPMAKMGPPVCAEGMRHWREAHDLRLRKMAQDLAGGHSPDREAPCERIAALIAAYEEAGTPSVAIDTKAQEPLGTLLRAGRVRSTQALHACEHDCPSGADGVLMPHGLDDRVRHRGPMNLGVSHDTSPCACDSFRW